MLKKLVQILIIGTIIIFPGFSQKSPTTVILDTDMGLDDARALALLFCSPNIQIKAVVTSDGSSSPEAGYENVQRIFRYMNITPIPTGIGGPINTPPWREKSNTLGWTQWPPPDQPKKKPPRAMTIIESALNHEKQPVTYICLGPLTNLAEVIQKDRNILKHVTRVLYFGNAPDSKNPAWNTLRDIKAATLVFESSIPVWSFAPSGDNPIPFDKSLYDRIDKINTPAAWLIALTHRDPRVQKQFGTKHSMIWDETIILYLNKPELVASMERTDKNPMFRFTAWDKKKAVKLYLDLLKNDRPSIVKSMEPSSGQDLQHD
ncbi:MAG: hypothetical protein GF401_03755 [Chitinivibrionales bacterium]|nr:hypothetical protein [Chitinivibrionales bacterium]